MKFLDLFKRIEADRLSALLTWLLISCSALWLSHDSTNISPIRIWAAAASYIFFIISWLYCTIGQRPTQPMFFAALMMQWCCASLTFYLLPYNYSAILLILSSALLPYYMSLHRAVFTILVMHLPFYLIFKFHWQAGGMLLSTSLFFTFATFALLMSHTSRKEARAREASELLNRELKATQALLKTAAQQAERSRIARELHDTIGHHLTALSLQLQVANHPSCKNVKPHIETAYNLSNQLLQEVRETVTEMRTTIDTSLSDNIEAIGEAFHGIDIEVKGTTSALTLNNTDTFALTRIIQESLTNSVRHGKATKFVITFDVSGDTCHISLKDNGHQPHWNTPIEMGNGLTSIQDRVHAMKGKVEFNRSTTGFSTSITLTMREPND